MPEPRLTRRQKEAVYRRAGGRCEYCQTPAFFAPDPFSIEHIQPRAAGGPTKLENLALSCQGCNNFKHTATSAVDPATGVIAPLFHPRRDRWAEHFSWSEDSTLLLGKSPVGRATVSRLQLNRPSPVNLRRVLRAADEHPPAEGS